MDTPDIHKLHIENIKDLRKNVQKIKEPKNKTNKKQILGNLLPNVAGPIQKESNNKTHKRKIVISSMPPLIVKELAEEHKQTRRNEEFIEVLEKLSQLMIKRGDHIRSRAYAKAQENIMLFTDDIYSPEQLKSLRGIGPTILEKLDEYMKTGTLDLLEREKANPVNLLANIHGIGAVKAKQLVESGITTIEQLRENQDKLNAVQIKGLKYYEDILRRIPRSEIDEYNYIFKQTFDIVKEADSKYEIVGSYRRHARESGDIDVIITSDNPEVFTRFVDELVKQNIILEILVRGKHKCLVITKILGKEYARRVDFLYTTHREYPFSVLYFTGSKWFNTAMRGHALRLGYSLNEHGLSKMVDKKKQELIVDHDFDQERDIFAFLHMEYKKPWERVTGKDVIILNGPIAVVNNIVNLGPNPEIKLGPTKKIKVKVAKVKTEKNKGQNGLKQSPINIVTETMDNNKIDIKPLVDIKNESSTIAKIDEFKTQGISVLEHLSEPELTHMVEVAGYVYTNDTPIMTDNEYDILKEYINRRFPKNQQVNVVGAPVERNKAILPYEMASMDKIKPDSNALIQWKSKYTGPYVLSCKLDGVSGLYSTEGNKSHLYTRGDGKIGQDITHLIKYLKLPDKSLIGPVAVRGEFIIPKRVFDEKYKDKFANPRNMVAGLINKQSYDERVHDLEFVVYEVVNPVMKPSEQMAKLKEMGFNSVLNRKETAESLTNELLSATLLDWRQNQQYEIDGVIVANDQIYERQSGNPEHAFAFKMVISDQMAEAKVVDVIWTASKNGYLKPRVQIEPIRLGGVTIEFATGFNGKFIEENKIGIGALIQIIRSGDVIPYIKLVTMPAEHAKMPTVPHHWTETHVDIVIDDAETDMGVRAKNITAFFAEIGVDGLAKGNIKRIADAGYDTIPKIIHMTKTDFEKVGFKTLADKFVSGIQAKLAAASLTTIMSASNKFGRGISGKTVELIMLAEPDILTSAETDDAKVARLVKIKGIGKINALTFVQNISAFMTFLRECDLENKLNLSNAAVLDEPLFDTSNSLYNKKVVMTKVRDAEIIQYLAKVGGHLADAITADTFILIVKSKADISGKVKKAMDKGIAIMTPEEFKAKYMI